MSTDVRGAAAGPTDPAADARAWDRLALWSGWVAGTGLVTTTVLFLLDDANVLADEATFHEAGRESITPTRRSSTSTTSTASTQSCGTSSCGTWWDQWRSWPWRS